MSKRIITTYKKLNSNIKNAIQLEYPHGFEMQLTRMKHVLKGYFFDGFIFNHEDTTYLIECSRVAETNNFVVYNDDDEDSDIGDSDMEDTNFDD